MKPPSLDRPVPATPPDASAADAPAREARIAHLFRAARRAGTIHPLQHLIRRYRAVDER